MSSITGDVSARLVVALPDMEVRAIGERQVFFLSSSFVLHFPFGIIVRRNVSLLFLFWCLAMLECAVDPMEGGIAKTTGNEPNE